MAKRSTRLPAPAGGLLSFDAHPSFAPGAALPGSFAALLQQGLERAAEPLTPPPPPSETAPQDWRPWLARLFPAATRAGFAPRHERFWDWLWAITPSSDPEAFVGLWPRGGAKSSTVELGAVGLGLRARRRYGLYVRDTQDRADDSVSNIARLLESGPVAAMYPEHANRRVDKYGSSKGWRRNRIWTAGGFTVDALGLDVAARGAKLEDQRPDFLVFDDIDGRHDSSEATKKKTQTITDSILPAGTANAAVIYIQNLIIPHGIASQLADGRAGFLARRIVSGPEPAVYDLKTERDPPDPVTGVVRTRITGGTPTWQGQGLAECQSLMDRIGYPSFKREAQHAVADREGALWTSDLIDARRVAKPPARFKRVCVSVDPSGGGDDIGIAVGGEGYDRHGYLLADLTCKASLGPRYWAARAVQAYYEWGADVMVAERNFGGDLVKANIEAVDPAVPVRVVTASRGKDARAEPVASLYGDPDRPSEHGTIHHVGVFPEAEAEMTGWAPGDRWSPNRMDALVWLFTELMLGGPLAELPPPDTNPQRFAFVGR